MTAGSGPLGGSDGDRPRERFLVTGALGCIGAWTVRELVREGVAVVGFDVGRDPRRLALILSPDELARVTLVPGDITDLDSLERSLIEHDITNVIHLAALQVPFCRADPPLGARVNVVGTVNVFEAVRRRGDGMAPVVYTGSIGPLPLMRSRTSSISPRSRSRSAGPTPRSVPGSTLSARSTCSRP